jgi:hypothetical protein
MHQSTHAALPRPKRLQNHNSASGDLPFSRVPHRRAEVSAQKRLLW